MSDNAIAPEIFDRLREATAGNPETLAELCREYVSEARSTMAQLRDAIAEADSSKVRERAHYLKGSSMVMGARVLSQHCAILEQMGRDSDLREAEPALEQAFMALSAVEEALANELGPEALPAGSAA